MTSRTLPAHGTLSRHKYHRCKCGPCVDNYRAYQRTRHRKQAYGTWQPYVDAEPIRQHLLKLRDQGIAFTRVAELAGLYPATVGGFLYSLGPSRPRKERARPEIAAKILAVTAETATPGLVDATGTRRRLQALAAIGWPMYTHGARIGVSPATVSRLTHQKRVLARTAEAVDRCYQQLCAARPEDHGIPAGTARKMRNRAAAEGWPDPTFWEDMGGIDDPDAPETEQAADAPAGRDPHTAEEVRHLAQFGVSAHEIARRVGRSPSYVRSILTGTRAPGWRDRLDTAA